MHEVRRDRVRIDELRWGAAVDDGRGELSLGGDK